jgi:YtkA-like
MGPAGMAEMTAPVQALPTKEPGLYEFEIQPGMAGKWSLTLGAKVQGERETVRGAVTIDLSK